MTTTTKNNAPANDAANELANVQTFEADEGAVITQTSGRAAPKPVTFALPKGSYAAPQTIITPPINGGKRYFDFKHIIDKSKDANGIWTITVLDNNCSYVAMTRKR